MVDMQKPLWMLFSLLGFFFSELSADNLPNKFSADNFKRSTAVAIARVACWITSISLSSAKKTRAH